MFLKIKNIKLLKIYLSGAVWLLKKYLLTELYMNLKKVEIFILEVLLVIKKMAMVYKYLKMNKFFMKVNLKMILWMEKANYLLKMGLCK
jgi:hypothetical protein